MSIILSILAVAFAAFCVWLTMRVVHRRERRAKWMLAGAVGIPTLYVASFGPACWWFAQQRLPYRPPPPGWAKADSTWHRLTFQDIPYAPRVYWPIGWAAQHSDRLDGLIEWYATRTGKKVHLPTAWTANDSMLLWPDGRWSFTHLFLP